MEADDVLKALGVTLSGLSSEEARARLEKYGPNILKEEKRKTALQMFAEQFKDLFILLLISATIFSFLIGYYELSKNGLSWVEAYADSITISSIVFLCALVGFVQEYKAEKAIEALKRMAAPEARVLRDGKEKLIPAEQVVPGDILLLETGDRVPADAYLLDVVELRTSEAALTGESAPVEKKVMAMKANVPVAERKNMVFSATHVVNGRGKAVVVATGMQTEFGKIAKLVQETKVEETPLQKKLNKFAKKIAKIVVGVCILIFALEIFEVLTYGWRVEGFIQAFMSSVSLAVSAVPEGLPAMVTISLALGARELTKRNAVIRRLTSAETLGAVTVICSDKTGTLTKGEMTARKLYVDGKIVEVSGAGYEPRGEFYFNNAKISLSKTAKLLLTAGMLCNNSRLELEGEKWAVKGDPTEGALVVVARKAGFSKEELERKYKRVDEIPFTSERKVMTTLHVLKKRYFVFVKGATEVVLAKCSKLMNGSKLTELTKERREKIGKINESLAKEGLRILAIAYKTSTKKISKDDAEKDLVFLGLVCLNDPPRPDAVQAVELCKQAGIKVVMITGDHKLTALAIAKEMGIYEPGSKVLTGKELESISQAELEEIVETVSVYARVLPRHKLRIVKALKRKGHVVAMTGDGINDAPALKEADVGVAMGVTGTDVTKEASDLVLKDDNFATLVKAVERGRVTYDNIRKFVRYLLACNFDELLVIGTFAILGGVFNPQLFPLPLLPAMILWINLVTDGGPAISLSFDEAEADVMKKPPRSPKEGVMHGMLAFILASFIFQAFGTILVFSLEYYVWPAHGFGTEASLKEARTAAFVQTCMFELFIVWNCRSEKRSVWRMGKKAFENKALLVSVLLSLLLTIGITYFPLTQRMFHLVALSLTDLAYIFGVASLGLFVVPELFMGRRVFRWK